MRSLDELGTSYAGWILSSLAVAVVLVIWDWVKRRIWPPREDPERRAQAAAWAAVIAEAEEHTRERRPRDPHVLTLDEMPLPPDAPASTDDPIRNP
jgi:hypothetical protein